MTKYKNVSIESLGDIAHDILNVYSGITIFALQGDLGSGKTTLVKAMVEKLGGKNVSSPTFSIVQPYSSPSGEIFHFDLYRLSSADEVMEIGMDDYIHSGAFCFIEWPELILPVLPQKSSKLIIIEIQKDGFRSVEVKDL